MKLYNLEREAINVAIDSPSEMKVGAVLSKRNQRESAYNIMTKTHPNSRYYENGKQKTRRLHAEQRVLIRGRLFTDSATLVVARITKNGTLAIARPCEEICIPLIIEAGIKKVVYSISKGEWGILSIKEYLFESEITAS